VSGLEAFAFILVLLAVSVTFTLIGYVVGIERGISDTEARWKEAVDRAEANNKRGQP